MGGRTRGLRGEGLARATDENEYKPMATPPVSWPELVTNRVMFWYLDRAVFSKTSLAFTFVKDLKISSMLFSFSSRSVFDSVP